MNSISKYFRSNKDQNCYIKYRININNFNDFWCYDFKEVFKNYEYIIIEEFNVNLCNSNSIEIAKDLLQLFCNIMTVEKRIIVFPLDELLYKLYRSNYSDDIFMILDDLLEDMKFRLFESMATDFDDTNIYFYTGSKLGDSVLYNLELYYNSMEK